MCFWLCVNFLCMSFSSPYTSIIFYLIVFSFSACLFILISRLSDSGGIERFATAVFFINLCLIIYLILSNYSFRGVRRWIFINGVSYQPSEFLKISFPVVLSSLFASKRWGSSILTSALSVICLLLQPDIGNSILLSLVGLSMAFFWGVRKRFILLMLLINSLLILNFSIKVGYSNKRLRSFLYQGSSSISYQSFRAIQAIQNGGIVGLGAGKGQIKRFIPDAYSDFIFAVIGEELGLIGCMMVAASFLYFFLSSTFFAARAIKSIEGGSIFGISNTIFLQSWIHMASVVGIVPTKGITLPFISHGGSSLLASWIAVAMIVAMARNIKPYTQLEE